jgi:uncharacterized protein (DUF2141 family)
MKHIFILSTVLLSFTFLFGQTGQLQIIVSGIKSNKGDIKIALYNESGKSGFLSSLEPAYQKKIGKIKSGKVLVTFTNIPYGIYAVSLFQDENSDTKFNQGPLGYPLEPYGVSGNLKKTGPPKFEECKFDLNTSFKKLTINLQLPVKKKQM